MYYFRWQSPVSGGKLKSFHTLEIPFVMENVDEARGMTGEGKDRYALQDKISAAWTNFAEPAIPVTRVCPTARFRYHKARHHAAQQRLQSS